MSVYPAAIADLRLLQNRNGNVYDVDKKTVFFAEDLNNIIAEIEAIETELGLNPKGTYIDVVARLNAISSIIPLTGFADNVAVSGVIDGANRIFTLPQSPNPAMSLILISNGIVQNQGIEYTLVNDIITYTTPPNLDLNGLPHKAFYRY